TAAEFPPDDISYSVTTDQDGTAILSSIQIGTHGATVNRATLELYWLDGTDSGATIEIHGSVGPGDLTLTFAGAAPTDGYYLLDQEIIYVSGVSGFGATIERGCFGTTPATHSAVNTTIGTVNADWNLDLIVGTGLSISPGMRASNSTPAGN